MMTLEHDLSMPPIFTSVVIDPDRDSFDAAREMAAAGADPATIVWSPRDDQLDCAIILSPEAPLAPSLLVIYVAFNAIGDTLGALIPPVIPLAFGWPDRLLMNGGTVGGLRAEWAKTELPGDIPHWMIVNIQLSMRVDTSDAAPVRAANHTTMEEEGCGDLTSVAVLESLSRHFLYWMNRWQDESFGPVKAAWLARAAGYGSNTDLETGGKWADRKLLWLNVDGSVQCANGDTETTETLDQALRDPTWQS